MSRRIDETTIPFLKDKGYGKGTNYTTDLVASLMLQYADAIVKSLDGNTVKLRESCPDCGSNSVIDTGNTTRMCYDCKCHWQVSETQFTPTCS